MIYDFQTVIDRKKQGSSKWNAMYKINPDSKVIPFSVADMEFMTAPEIVSGLQKKLENTILGYAHATDDYWLAVQQWQKKRHNFDVLKEWMVNTPGVVFGINIAVRGLI